MRYEIRLKGHLAARWAARFDGMTLTTRADGTTMLVGTAVALFPVLKRQNEALALGHVGARLVECTFIAIGIVSLLAVVTLRQDFTAAAGGDPGSFVTAGRSLVAVHDWTFLLGPNWVVGVGNGLILGWLMHRSGLVPRGMALLGLAAGPMLLAGGTPRCSASSSPAPP
jgi:hypothetical protein